MVVANEIEDAQKSRPILQRGRIKVRKRAFMGEIVVSIVEYKKGNSL
jgi:hypothetical protein